MYKTCMFCNRPLGTNEVVEHFPVGRRLAFDAERGRLWVVCRKCERWNLSPLEERWEAVETCERLFRDTRIRVSTENVGLAKHPEGLELVRIGRPMRPEFAAWRYGDQFGRRRKRAMIYGVGGAVVIGGIVVGGAVAGVLSGALLAQSGNFVNLWVNGRTLAKLRTDSGRIIKLKNPDLLGTRLRSDTDGHGFSLEIRRGKKKEWFEGEEAERLIGQIIPKMNRRGGKRETVQTAVSEIEHHGHPDDFLSYVVFRRPLQGQERHSGIREQDARTHEARPGDGPPRGAGAARARRRAVAARAGVGGSRRDRGDCRQPPAPRRDGRLHREAPGGQSARRGARGVEILSISTGTT